MPQMPPQMPQMGSNGMPQMPSMGDQGMPQLPQMGGSGTPGQMDPSIFQYLKSVGLS
jgi:hypothetical protein